MKNVPSEHLILGGLWCDGNTCRTLSQQPTMNPKILFFSFCIYGSDAKWGGNGISGVGWHGAIMPHIELTFGYTAHRISRRYYSSICTAPSRRNAFETIQWEQSTTHTYTKYTSRIYSVHVDTSKQRSGETEIEFGELAHQKVWICESIREDNSYSVMPTIYFIYINLPYAMLRSIFNRICIHMYRFDYLSAFKTKNVILYCYFSCTPNNGKIFLDNQFVKFGSFGINLSKFM